MTVRVRQVIRVSAGGVAPPVPPGPPTMAFLQQPTDTISGLPFEPPIFVTLSNHATDTLEISSVGSNCAITPMQATAGPGGAEFTGLLAGTVGTGCRLEVRNLSNPQVQPIISAPYNTLAAPVPVMEFIVQPTNTDILQPILPEVTVVISAGGLTDNLTATSTCPGVTPVTVNAVNGIAVFTGLAAGSIPNNGCRIVVTNNSNPAVLPITSEPFDITEPIEPPPSEFEFINFIVAVSPDGNTTTTDAIDTTDADLIVLTITTDVYPGLVEDSIFGVPTGNVWTPVFTTPNTIIYYTRPIQAGGAHRFRFSGPGAWAAMGVAAFTGWDGSAPTVFDRSPNDAQSPAVTLTAAPPGGPLSSGAGNLSITFVGSWRAFLQQPVPVGYTYISAGYIPTSYGQALAYKLISDVTENPVWIGSSDFTGVSQFLGGWVIFKHA